MMLVAGIAAAQPSDAVKRADALFSEGRALVDAGKFSEACPKFEESQRLDSGLGTMLYLADCYERAGRTASAWATFREAAATARAAGQADREQIARARAEALEPKLHRHALKVEDASEGLTLERVEARTGRREPLARATWGVALPVDPGSYRLDASAPGKTPWSQTIEVPPSPGTTTTVVPALVAGAPAAAAPVPPTAPGPQQAPPPVDADRGDGQRLAGIVVGAAGVAGLGLAGIFSAMALSNDGDADELCAETTCPTQEGVDASDDAVAMGNVATGAVVAGGVLLAAGIILYVTAPGAADAATGQRRAVVALKPAARGADAGLSFSGSF